MYQGWTFPVGMFHVLDKNLGQEHHSFLCTTHSQQLTNCYKSGGRKCAAKVTVVAASFKIFSGYFLHSVWIQFVLFETKRSCGFYP